jgi:hypothetical protein
MIQKRLDTLKPYFKGIKVAENYRIVEVNLKNTWVIPEDDEIEVQQKQAEKNQGMIYNMFYSDKKSFDDILNYIEIEVINHNLEIEQKEALLRAKVEELKRVFEDKSLDELNGLKFTTEDNSLKLGNTKNNNILNIENKNGATKELSTDSKSK